MFYLINLVNVKNVLCFTMWTSLVKDFVDNISLREWYKNIVGIKNAKHTEWVMKVTVDRR